MKVYNHTNQGSRDEQKAFALMMRFFILFGIIAIAFFTAGVKYGHYIIDFFTSLNK